MLLHFSVDLKQNQLQWSVFSPGLIWNWMLDQLSEDLNEADVFILTYSRMSQAALTGLTVYHMWWVQVLIQWLCWLCDLKGLHFEILMNGFGGVSLFGRLANKIGLCDVTNRKGWIWYQKWFCLFRDIFCCWNIFYIVFYFLSDFIYFLVLYWHKSYFIKFLLCSFLIAHYRWGLLSHSSFGKLHHSLLIYSMMTQN